jgi:hypothetical protein
MRALRKSRTFGVALLWIGGLVSPTAYPTSCFPEESQHAFRISKAKAIFSGAVLRVEPAVDSLSSCAIATVDGPQCGAKVVTLEVAKVWKATLGKQVRVFVRDACRCRGVYAKTGERLLVFARELSKDAPLEGNPPFDWVALDTCLGTAPWQSKQAQATLKKLGK